MRGAAPVARSGSACLCVCVCVCVSVCARARARLGCSGQRDSRRPVGDCGVHPDSVAAGSVCGMTEWQGVVPRAQCGDWVWRRSLGRAQRFPRVAAAGVRGGGPCVPPGCPGRAEQPGRLPKVFVQASHGSGAKKMAGLPNFCGAGEGREGRAGCQPWPRLFADPGRRSRGAPPPQKKKNFPRRKLSGPNDPGCRAVDQAGLGNPVPLPGGGRGWREPRTLPTVLGPRRRVSRGRCADLGALRKRVPPPAKFPALRSAGSKGPGDACPATPPSPVVAPGSERAQKLPRAPQQPW